MIFGHYANDADGAAVWKKPVSGSYQKRIWTELADNENGP